MNAQERRDFFLSFVHFCQEIGFGGVKDTVIFKHTPLFCNDWYRKIRRGSKNQMPNYFTWGTLPPAWQEFDDFLSSSFPQGIIREIKLQEELPITWDHSRPSRSAPNIYSKVRKVYVLKDASSLLKYAAESGTSSQNEMSRIILPPGSEEKK